MEVLEKTITHTRPDVFDIYPIGDLHAGSVDCAEHALERVVEKIRSNKNAYWIGMGDYADSILKNDPRFEIMGLAPWVKKDNIVESQRRWLNNLLKPIAPKCLAFLEGNHEWEIHKRYQDDLIRNLCDDLSLPYGGYSCFLLVKFERTNTNTSRVYNIHAWHGAGAAQSDGGRLMRLMRLVNDFKADIYLMGHLHAITIHIPDRLGVHNGRVRSENIIAATTGSWLKTYTQPKNGEQLNASYGEMKGYLPSRIGCPIIHINPDKNVFSIEG